MRYLSIDALPLLFEGGISNYTRPLVESVLIHANSRWHVELLFRLSISRSHRQLYTRYLGELALQKQIQKTTSHKVTYLPDRLLMKIWERGISFPLLKAKDRKDAVLATTEMVPEKSGVNVGWIVYDLIPLRIPQYFSVDSEEFLKSTLERARRTDFIVAISESTKQDIVELLHYPEEKICVIYPGTDLARTPSKPKIDSRVQRPYVHYRGALSHNKNVDGMLRIFARCVHEHGLDIDIIFSGKDFCGKTYWTQMIRDLDIAGRVHFAGWVTREELENLLINATMLWQFSWYEGFGLPVLEAASRGIPVLYTNRGAVPEILQNPEQEIDPSDEEQAAARAAAALKSPEILKRWKILGLSRATKFSWDKSAQGLLSWLENHL